MPDLRQIEENILADCTVDGHEVEVLRPQLHAGGKIHRREPDFLADPAESAKAAGLRYVSDTLPGIARVRTGKEFDYIDTGGKRIGQVSVLERIKNLAIPPAWIKVWICADPDGHLQADGRDARDRKQYRYHPRWRAAPADWVRCPPLASISSPTAER